MEGLGIQFRVKLNLPLTPLRFLALSVSLLLSYPNDNACDINCITTFQSKNGRVSISGDLLAAVILEYTDLKRTQKDLIYWWATYSQHETNTDT